MLSDNFRSKATDLNADIEIAIAKIINKKNIKDPSIKIGVDDNNNRCVLFNGCPIRKLHIEDNLTILENLENRNDVLA